MRSANAANFLLSEKEIPFGGSIFGLEMKALSADVINDQILTRKLFSAQVSIYLESGDHTAASIPLKLSVIVAHHPSAWFSTTSELKHLICISYDFPRTTMIKLSSGDHLTLVITSGKIKCCSRVKVSESKIVISLVFEMARKYP